jgi:TolB-like protein
VHIREDVDFSFIKKVAVLPFENNSDNKSAGEIVRQLVISELLASGLVDVVYSGDVMAALKRQDIREITSLTSKQIRNLGKDLKVQAIITGSVNRFGMTRMGKISAPEVTVTIMMADTDTGSIIWSTTVTRGGADFWARHFGTRAETLSETALAVVREAIATLYQY